MEILTKLEELVLIAVLKLKDEAYGISIYRIIVELTGKEATVSAVYFPLERLVRKGYLRSHQGAPTPKRGGMSKKFYRVTKSGIQALRDNRSLSEAAWRGVPEILEDPLDG